MATATKTANEQIIYSTTTKVSPNGFVEFDIQRPSESSSLDKIRLMLNDAMISEEYQQILLKTGFEKDGKFHVGSHEVKRGIEELHSSRIISYILECYHTSTLVEICNRLGYKQSEKSNIQAPESFNDNRNIIFVNERNSKDMIFSKIYPNERSIKENIEPEYLGRCMKHIALTAWLRSHLKNKVELIIQLLNNAPSIRNKKFEAGTPINRPDNSLWVLKLQLEGQFQEFMEAAGYQNITHNYPQGMIAWETKPFAYQVCPWVFGNFIHSNPVSISSQVYLNDEEACNLIIMMNVWRRLQATYNATKDVLGRIGYKF